MADFAVRGTVPGELIKLAYVEEAGAVRVQLTMYEHGLDNDPDGFVTLTPRAVLQLVAGLSDALYQLTRDES